MASLSKYNSANFADLQSSIDHAKENKLTLSNVCPSINVKGEMIMDQQNVLKNYEGMIFQNLVKMDMPEKYYYRPEHLSQDLYGTPDLWYLLLWINRMSTMHQFARSSISVYDPNKMALINQIIEKEKTKIAASKENPPLVQDLTLQKIIV